MFKALRGPAPLARVTGPTRQRITVVRPRAGAKRTHYGVPAQTYCCSTRGGEAAQDSNELTAAELLAMELAPLALEAATELLGLTRDIHQILERSSSKSDDMVWVYWHPANPSEPKMRSFTTIKELTGWETFATVKARLLERFERPEARCQLWWSLEDPPDFDTGIVGVIDDGLFERCLQIAACWVLSEEV